jgi:hypothetical protein
MFSDSELSNMNEFIKTFEKWLNNYFEWFFDFALLEFETANKLRKDPVSDMFIKRCEKMIKTPKKTWDWIRIFDKK